jgi:esterase/lipase superfamily enzyme
MRRHPVALPNPTVRLSARAIILVLLSCIRALAQPSSPPVTNEVSIGPSSTVRSQLHLKQGDFLKVTVTSAAEDFAADLYIYDSSGTLQDKDDSQSASPFSDWQAQSEGDYYVLARNLSGRSGMLSVGVTHGRELVQSTSPAYAVMRLFYATDRKSNPSNATTDYYGVEPDQKTKLHFGQAFVSIPRDHRMGELEGPSILRLEVRDDPAKHVVLQRIQEQDAPSFWRVSGERLKHSQNKEALVFIPGFNTTFSDAARRTAQIAYDLGFDGPVFLYSWPSQGRADPLDYNKDVRNADLSASNLKEFLLEVATLSQATQINIIAHSMGNRVLTSALRDISLGQGSQKTKLFNEVALMAPDVDANLFIQLASVIQPSVSRITLYASSRDKALLLSQLYAGYPRAGEGGAHILIVPAVQSIDASTVDTSLLGFDHEYFADSKNILSDLFHLLRGEAPDSRTGLHRQNKEAGVYWIFVTGS